MREKDCAYARVVRATKPCATPSVR